MNNSKMDSHSFIEKSMEYLIENLPKQMQAELSDEFLSTLNRLIGIGTECSVLAALKRQESASCQKRRLTNTSSSSEDVRCVSVEIETVELDSDSEESVSSMGNSTLNASTSLDVQSETMVQSTAPSTCLKRVNLDLTNEPANKRCEVKLRRIDKSLASIQTKNDDSAPSQIQEKKPPPDSVVSLNENIPDSYLKRYSEICSSQ